MGVGKRAYVQINAFPNGWAKTIVIEKHKLLLSQGYDSYVFWGFGDKTQNEREVCLLPRWQWLANKIWARFDGKKGFHSKMATKRLVKRLDAIQPETVHLHSLYDDYINLEVLFQWLARSRCKVIWTMHDCWAFTGFCLYFSKLGCEKWRTECTNSCPCPASGGKLPAMGLKKNVQWSYAKKKELFTSIPHDRLVIQTPSEWMKELVEQSFLGDYEINVVRNEIDKSVFFPKRSDFRETNRLEDKIIVLGVANPFSERKGFGEFLKLSRDLNDKFAIVMVGVDDDQAKQLESSSSLEVRCLPATNSQHELAQVYSAADVLFNPTSEDNYPTVNLEAQACGTPVVTYDVGGCRETLFLEKSCAVAGYEEALDRIKAL